MQKRPLVVKPLLQCGFTHFIRLLHHEGKINSLDTQTLNVTLRKINSGASVFAALASCDAFLRELLFTVKVTNPYNSDNPSLWRVTSTGTPGGHGEPWERSRRA
ncbi:hypothetical protein H920_00544 [Fukomys damarensis]|uniref:Uncharacterized protein n=1 Tax=Fukomys damarensis TaxID=885580 RepID=A0A091E1B7_FUKDA|nr:hypothetical protein H920_00544 [Fukomys damarensis]